MIQEINQNILRELIKIAKDSTCQRSKCGSIITKNKKIIGKGFNSPPGNLEPQRRCSIEKSDYNQKVTDKTCCIHAEQRAMFDALSKNSKKLKGSTLFFLRLDENNKIKPAGKPYCTICSKMALDLGIKYFALFHNSGWTFYPTEEYNNLSYAYGTQTKTL